MDISVVVPTFNEAPNIAELVARIDDSVSGFDAEIIFVDDSTDDTPLVISRVIARTTVRLIHRTEQIGGLSGAVVAGIRESVGDWVIVMDGDLQHPPEMIPILVTSGQAQSADLVVASRHIVGGSSAGLDGRTRALASAAAKMLTRAMFPIKLRSCSDPMTGFFAVRRESVEVSSLQPQGFKILLEILARSSLTVVEEPFTFAERQAGESKATFSQGLRFLSQLTALRFGKLSGFAVIGAIGALANLVIMAVLQAAGVWYLSSAIIAAVVTIVANFLLQERFIFGDLTAESRSTAQRFALSFGFNATETVVRTTALWAIVEATSMPSLVVQAVLIAIGFLARFVYHSRVVYRPRPRADRAADAIEDSPYPADHAHRTE